MSSCTEKKQGYPAAGLILLVIMLTMMYAQASLSDKQNCIKLHEMNGGSHCSTFSEKEVHCIEHIIRDHKQRKSINKSQSSIILRSAILGAIRGALGGAVLGGESGIIPGAIAFGSLNGILTWSGSHIKTSKYVDPNDNTAK